MRILLASLFVVAGMMLAVGLLPGVMNRVAPVLVEFGMAAIFIVLIGVAMALFNPSWQWRGYFKSEQERIRDLEERGLLVSTDFEAVRAFQVEEYEDEGLHYFIALQGGGVLCLTGQYLYDYEALEDEDDDELNQPKSFPCTRFTVRRLRDDGFVLDILCRGEVLEPEWVAPAFGREEYRRGRVPEDGDIITDESFDELQVRLGQTR